MRAPARATSHQASGLSPAPLPRTDVSRQCTVCLSTPSCPPEPRRTWDCRPLSRDWTHQSPISLATATNAPTNERSGVRPSALINAQVTEVASAHSSSSVRAKRTGSQAEAGQQTQVCALHRSQRRLVVMTWNAGGLSSTLWQELLLTVDRCRPEARPQIICVQESHWRDNIALIFVTAHWHGLQVSRTRDAH